MFNLQNLRDVRDSYNKNYRDEENILDAGKA